MFKRSVSSRGMRLVAMTNSQKRSVPRLDYKAFGGTKPARSRKENRQHVERIIGSIVVGTGVGRVGGNGLGRPEEFLAARPRRQPAVGSGGVRQYSGSRGKVGVQPSAAVWRSANCGDSGAVARGVGIYAYQVPALGSVPSPPHHGG